MSEALVPGFGAELRQAREGKGLDIAEVAERLKLSSRQVEAIEAEDWSRLPDLLFVRGFVRNYARILDLDTTGLIHPLDASQTTTQTITVPSAGVRLGKSPLAKWLLFPLAGLLGFVLVVALLYQWLSQGEDAMLSSSSLSMGDASPPATTAPSDTSVAQAGSTPETLVQPLALSPKELGQPDSAAAVSTPPAAQPDKADAASPAAVASPSASLQAAAPVQAEAAARSEPPVTAPTPAAGRHALRFRVREDAWIQVVDSQGLRYSKLLQAGQSEALQGTPPFRLVVGNAAHVDLTYDGRAIDISPFIGEKVARLTLE